MNEREEKEELATGEGRGAKIALAVGGSIFLILFIAYLVGVFYYQNHYLPGTLINGIDTSNRTDESVGEDFEEQAKTYSLTVKERNGSAETIQGIDVAFRMSYGESFDRVLAEQSPFTWIFTLFSTTEETVNPTSISFDEEALDGIIDELDCMDSSTWTKCENAKLSEYDEKEGYTIKEAVYGTTLDKDIAAEAIREAMKKGDSEVDLTATDCYEQPEYTSDSPEVEQMLDTANKYADADIKYTFGDDTEEVDGSVISGWISQKKKPGINLDEDAIADYVAGLAEKYDTVNKERKFKSTTGVKVTVPAGTYGWKIDQEATVKSLTKLIKDGKSYEGDVEYSQTAASHAKKDFGDTYVEVDLSTQHLYYYKDGKQVVSTDFVSGCVSKSRETPTGAYYVVYKQKDATLKGQGYSTPVDFWMPFFDGCGLHDATWRSSFGGTIYLYHGSHGCINLPLSVAETIFGQLEEGTPVLVFESVDNTQKYASIKAAAAAAAKRAAEAAKKKAKKESEDDEKSSKSDKKKSGDSSSSKKKSSDNSSSKKKSDSSSNKKKKSSD